MVDQSTFVDYLIAFECDGLDEDQLIELFQYIYDNNLIGGLQGVYHRVLRSLIDQGYIKTAASK